MKGATSNETIVPEAEGMLRVPADVPEGFVDVICYYSPAFTGTLLSDNDILRCNPEAKNYCAQVMTKYFASNDSSFSYDLRTRASVDLGDPGRYNLDYGNCTLTCVHSTTKRRNLVIPGIIRAGL